LQGAQLVLFPALGKKVFVRNHASRATVEKCTPFLEKGDAAAMSKKLIRLLVGAALTVAVAYVLATHMDKVRANVSQRDSIQYWAAGKLLVRRNNPYDVKSTAELEWEQGYAQSRPLLVRTPPWSLFLFLPLGLVNAFWGWMLWMAASAASLILAMRLSRNMFQKSDELRSVFLFVGYLFAPVLACLEAAQIGFVLLIGIVLFLYFEKERPFQAGAALVLPFAKPHLLFFWLASFCGSYCARNSRSPADFKSRRGRRDDFGFDFRSCGFSALSRDVAYRGD
jgi:hypothetical protein